MSESSFFIQQAYQQDIPNIVNVHCYAFPKFFLTFMGKNFLMLLYKSYSEDHVNGILLVAKTEGQVVGVVAGVVQQRGFYRKLIERKLLAFAFASLKAILAQPKIVPRLVRALKRPDEAGESAAEACLMSIAVLPEWQGCGIGKKLVEAFSDELRRRGVTRFCLTTDKDHNEAVNQFYLNNGFVLARSFRTPEGRWMNEYVKEL